MARKPKICGVYQITLTIDDRCYIGSSVNIEERLRVHRRSLERGEHHSQHLQRAWDKYGPDAFSWTILEECDRDDKLIREQFYMDTVGCDLNGYPVAGSPKNHTISDETRERMSAAQKIAQNDPEKREATRLRMLGNQYRKGIPHTEETKAQLRESSSQYRHTPETLEKMRVAMLGKNRGPHSPEHNQKITEGLLARNYSHSEETKAKIGASNRATRERKRLEAAEQKAREELSGTDSDPVEEESA